MVSILYSGAKLLKQRISLKVKRLPEAFQAKGSERDLFSVSKDELYLSTSNNKAESPIGDDNITVATVSATGEGVLTHWINAEESVSVSPMSSLLLGSSSSTLRGSNSTMMKKFTIKIPALKKRPTITIKIPASKLRSSPESPSSILSAGSSETITTEKLTIIIPASRKRTRDDDDAVLACSKRPRSVHTSSAMITPAQPTGDLIYSCFNKCADPVTIATSSAEQGPYTRWTSPTVIHTSATAVSEVEDSRQPPDDEFCAADTYCVPEKNKKLIIGIPPKSRKRTRDSENDQDYDPARYTRSRLSTLPSPAVISTISTTSANSSNPPIPAS